MRWSSWNFNSIKVRLEQGCRRGRKAAQGNFNSIKVRLEQHHRFSNAPTARSFQFHKGTIRTTFSVCRIHFGAQFQFHKGTIRTFAVFIVTIKINDFNSIKVRLELDNREEATVIEFEFQFHKGTIRTSSSASLRASSAAISIP